MHPKIFWNFDNFDEMDEEFYGSFKVAGFNSLPGNTKKYLMEKLCNFNKPEKL